MKRKHPRFKLLLTLVVLLQGILAHGQAKYWTGGSGYWDDASHWSTVPNGTGGASVPRANEDVHIDPARGLTIELRGPVSCKDLIVIGDVAAVRFIGGNSAVTNITGALKLVGNVNWDATGPVRMTVRREGVEVDTRGNVIGGDVIFDGSGSWSVISAFETVGNIRLEQGTLIANGNVLTGRGLLVGQNGNKELIAGNSVIALEVVPDRNSLRDVVRTGTSTLVVDGNIEPWGFGAAESGDRDVNICGTGAGQTPFTVTTTLVTNYNGFGVRCRGNCNATVTVVVTGGSGNFTYQWLNGGPPTATWTTACGGPQLVVVTDVVQGISCPVQVQVSEPAPLGVIFFGPSTPPTCANVCNGTRTAAAIGGVSPYTYRWNNGAGTAPSFNMLCAGSNTLRITDANNCIFDTTFVFNVLPIAPNLTFTNVNCNGVCEGTATVAPSGGTGAYTVTWAPQPIMVQGQFNAVQLCAGNYSVNIRDANGCDTTVTFMITQPPPIVPNLSHTNATCSNSCNGTATVMPTGATGPFTYLWTPAPGGTGQGTPSVTGLCAGNYTVRITRTSTGCFIVVPFIVTAPPAITVQRTITNALCANSCDGGIVLAVTGGTGPYSYLWSPVPPVGQGTGSISGLCPGNWQVTVTDAVNCDTTLTYMVGSPPPLVPTLTTTNVRCAGACNGTASVTVSGGVTPYTYLWTPTPGGGAGTPNATGLCAGMYTVRVRDANGCDSTLTFEITQPLPLTATQSQTNITCRTLCNGTASVVVSGGTTPYTYLWTPAPPMGQGTPNASGLCAGPRSVLITDARGCTLTVNFTILNAVPIQVSLQLQPASCPGICNGGAGAIVIGGVSPYTYLWTPAPGAGAGTPNVSGLCPQAYSLRVTDAVGCDTTISFTITAPPRIVPNSTRTNATCAGTCDGTATVMPTGGNGTFTYTWVPTPPVGSGTASVSGLCAGNWQVTIASGGCDTTITIIITQPPPITANVTSTQATCSDVCNGSAMVTASGGTGGFTYLWTPVPGSGQGTANPSQMCPGTYTVTIRDVNNCELIRTVQIISPAPILPGLTTTPELCAGPCTGTATLAPSGGTGTITVNWQPAPGAGQGTTFASGLCAGTTYMVTLTDGNGCDTTVTFNIQPSTVIVPNSSSTPVSCSGDCNGTATVGPTGGVAPYTYLWSPPPGSGQGTPSVTGLCEGTVQVRITDAAGCITVAQILITGPTAISDNATVTPVLCAGQCTGAITLDTQGGVGPYTYAWTPVPPIGAGTGTISGLCAGPRNVLITDATGCTASFTYIINSPQPIVLEVLKTPSNCQVCIGSATVIANGGTGTLQVEWRDGDGILIGTDTTIMDLCAGIYMLTVTDENGCFVTEFIPITDSDGESILTTGGVTSCPGTCDGVVNVDFNCGDPPCSIRWRNSMGVVLPDTTNSVGGLCPGTYTVSVTNASGCITIATATVEPSVDPTLSMSSTGTTCTGGCDGTATAGITAGTPPFTFLWNPAPGTGQGTPHVTGLCAGVYTVTVNTGGGCETTAEVLITEPPPIAVLNALIAGVSCNGVCDGNVTLLVLGGTGPYTYQWTPAPQSGQGNSAAFGFCAGPISVLITDANGCTRNRSYVVPEPLPLQVVTTFTISNCPVCDGTATASVVGGTAPYGYSWMLGGVEVSTGQAPTGLCGGTYQLTVRDAAGCSVQRVVQIPSASGETLTPINGQTLCGNDCNGEAGVSYNCSLPPCTSQWFDIDGNLLAEDTNTLSGLCNGTYSVQVTNASNCVSFVDVTVTPSQIIVPNLSSTRATCSGVCDATATVGPMGGIPPYSFNWTPEPGGGNGGPQATGLCAGVYQVLIADASGCDTTVSVLILEPEPLVQAAVVTDVSCNGTCDGRIVVTTTGGTAPYTFLWTPAPPNGQGTNNAFNLCAGDYDLLVTDANGCTNTTTWTVGEPPLLTISGGSISSECGLCNGTAFATPSGGTAPFNFTWTQNGSIFGTQDILSPVCPGLYTVLVSDAAGCTASLLVPVQDINGEVLTTTGDTTSCPGICDGTVSVTFNCSSPDCTIAWFDAIGTDLNQSANTVSGLCAGLYLVQVTNGNGCVSIDSAYVTEPPLIVANLSTTPVTCFGDCDGTATVGPTGGVAPYTYNWDPTVNGQGTPQAVDLCAGVYEVTITDDAGCILITPVLILGPAMLAPVVDVTPVTCNGACDASIVITPVGGIGPYVFNWSPEPPNGPGGTTAEDLCAGDWTVQVVDANGCDTTITITIIDPPVLEAQLSTTSNICFGDCIGTAAAAITGGVAPYTIVWSDATGTIAQDTTEVGSLCAGDHILMITDASGCVLTIPFTITEGAAINAGLTFIGETCNGPCDGTAMVSPSGGSGTFDLFWQPDPVTGQGTEQVSLLCADNYTVTITDQLGCDSTFAFTILPYTPISDNATVTDLLCNGICDGSVITNATGGIGVLIYNWTPEPPNGPGDPSATGLCADAFDLQITDAAGCDTSFSYMITEPVLLELIIDEVTGASCSNISDGAIATTALGGMPSYTFAWTGPNNFTSALEDISGLAIGVYDLTLTDLNGCTVVVQITIEALVTVVADAGADRTACLSTTVLLDGTSSLGATTYEWTDAQGVVISDSATASVNGTGTGPVTYTLTVSDGACISSDDVTITFAPLPIANAGPDHTIFLSEVVTLGGAPSGPPGSTYSWMPDSLVSAVAAPNPTTSPSVTTWFTLTVVGPNGCVDVDSVLVTVVPTVVIPTGFTPNSDGRNDTWIIDNIELFPNCEVEVYNRWGDLLFRSVGYRQPWNGKYRDGYVPVGTYYYVVELNDARFPEPYTGPLTVIR